MARKYARVFNSFVLLYDPTDQWPADCVYGTMRLRADMRAAKEQGQVWWADGCRFRVVGDPPDQVLTLKGGNMIDGAGHVVHRIAAAQRQGKRSDDGRQRRASELFDDGMTYFQIAVVLDCTKSAVCGLLQKWRSKLSVDTDSEKQ